MSGTNPAPSQVQSLTVREAAEALRCSTRTIRHLIATGALAAFTVGNGPARPAYRVSADAIRGYIASKTVGGAK